MPQPSEPNLSMDHHHHILLPSLLLLQLIQTTAAQALADPYDDRPLPPDDPSLSSNFQPSLAVVIGMLAVMFSLTFVLLLYAKFCHRPSSIHSISSRPGTARSPSEDVGLDKTVVESLPFFPFSSLRGLKQGLDCSVCLSRFDEADILRLLPGCRHGFHMDCIDRWLESRSTCPLCRRHVSANDVAQCRASSSFRFLSNESMERGGDREPDGYVELYIEREGENRSRLSSRLDSIERSFRKLFDRREDVAEEEDEEEQPMQRAVVDNFHKFNHRISFSMAMRSRWSNVSSSDLLFLGSELLNDMSNGRFPSNERQTDFDKKQVSDYSSELQKTSSSCDTKKQQSFEGLIHNGDKRSMSEIVIYPRLMTELSGNDNTNINHKNSFSGIDHPSENEERMRKLWVPIASKTARWFVNREKRPAET